MGEPGALASCPLALAGRAAGSRRPEQKGAGRDSLTAVAGSAGRARFVGLHVVSLLWLAASAGQALILAKQFVGQIWRRWRRRRRRRERAPRNRQDSNLAPEESAGVALRGRISNERTDLHLGRPVRYRRQVGPLFIGKLARPRARSPGPAPAQCACACALAE